MTTKENKGYDSVLLRICSFIRLKQLSCCLSASISVRAAAAGVPAETKKSLCFRQLATDGGSSVTTEENKGYDSVFLEFAAVIGSNCLAAHQHQLASKLLATEAVK